MENKYIMIWNDGEYVSLPFTDILNVKDMFNELNSQKDNQDEPAELYLLTKVGDLRADPPCVKTVATLMPCRLGVSMI